MGKKAFGIIAYYFDNNGQWMQGRLEGKERDFAKEDADPHYLDHEGADLATEKQLTPFAPKIEKILLAKYLKNPSAKWRVAKDKSMRDQGADSDEKAEAAAAKTFRKEDAAQLWKSENPATSQQQTK